jgi:predicted DsbA family dithiol-disulfide isomerase
MFTKHTLVALGLGIALGALSIPAVGQNDSTVIAEIGGRKITADDFEQNEAGKLLQAKYKYYLAERDVLNQFIDDQLLELQAKKEGVTLDELLKRHVAVNVPEPTEDQLRFYYEGVQTDEPYESARPHIIETVHQLRMTKARAAEAAHCAGAQGKFWEYHDSLFQTKRLQKSDLKDQARALKLDSTRFDQCLEGGEQIPVVKKDAQEAQRLGLQGTPSFFINGHFMTGSIGFMKLRETVMQELSATAAMAKQRAALQPSTGIEKK